MRHKNLSIVELLATNITVQETINAAGVITASSGVVGDLTGDIIATAETGEVSPGAIGTGVAPVVARREEDGVIITTLKIDLTGLASAATANDVIGGSAGVTDIAIIGRNILADNGVIFKVEFSCIETPVGGDDDVNVVSNVSAILEVGDAGGTAYLANSGDLVAGQTIQNLVPAITADHYFYLTAGTGDTAAEYTAGQYILTTYGHPVLT